MLSAAPPSDEGSEHPASARSAFDPRDVRIGALTAFRRKGTTSNPLRMETKMMDQESSRKKLQQSSPRRCRTTAIERSFSPTRSTRSSRSSARSCHSASKFEWSKSRRTSSIWCCRLSPSSRSRTRISKRSLVASESLPTRREYPGTACYPLDEWLTTVLM